MDLLVPLIAIIILIISFAVGFITKIIIKNKENANKKLPLFTALMSIVLMVGIIVGVRFINQQIANNRIVGEWQTFGETIEFQRRDRRVYVNGGFIGNWSMRDSRLRFYYLDDTTEWFWVSFEDDNNTVYIYEWIDGQREGAIYWRVE